MEFYSVYYYYFKYLSVNKDDKVSSSKPAASKTTLDPFTKSKTLTEELFGSSSKSNRDDLNDSFDSKPATAATKATTVEDDFVFGGYMPSSAATNRTQTHQQPTTQFKRNINNLDLDDEFASSNNRPRTSPAVGGGGGVDKRDNALMKSLPTAISVTNNKPALNNKKSFDFDFDFDSYLKPKSGQQSSMFVCVIQTKLNKRMKIIFMKFFTYE